MVAMERLADLESEPHALLFDGDEPRTIRLSLAAGESVAEHSHPGRSIVLSVIDGAIDLSLDGETYALEGGEVIRFDGERSIAPTAQEASTALVVLAAESD